MAAATSQLPSRSAFATHTRARGLAGQILIYPAVDAYGSPHPSRAEYLGLVVTDKAYDWYWSAYSGGRSIDGDPHATPLHAESLADLPPAILILGGCDFLAR